MYGTEVAEVYDELYVDGRGKDYAAEADALTALVRSRSPAAASLLDVACGTGGHLAHLRRRFERAAGVELSEAMRELAGARLPGVPVYAGDMRTFDVGATFDAVTCLFSSIGYVEGIDELRQAVTRMATHVNPGGVLVIERWFTPEEWHDGHVSYTVADRGGRNLVRMGHSSRAGRVSRMRDHYLVGDPGTGVRHFEVEHVMTLFTTEEYVDAIAAAGLSLAGWSSGLAEGRRLLTAVRCTV